MSASAHIQKFSKNNDGHTEYFIKVLFNGREWAIRKRYSEFIVFDEYLQKSGYKVSYTLPAKTWWKRFDQNVLSQRQKELQSYLDVLLKSSVSSENSLVREFLEVDINKLEFARRQTFREFTRNENMENIVATFRKNVIDIPSNKVHTIPTPSFARNRSLSVFKRINSLGTGYGAKSSSFSKGPMLRRGETVTSDSGNSGGTATPSTPTGRDRRFSMDIFSQMAGSSFKDMYYAGSGADRLHETSHQFVTAVDALWPHYAEPINEAIDELENGGDFPATVFEPFSDTLDSDILGVIRPPVTRQAYLAMPSNSRKTTPVRTRKTKSSDNSNTDELADSNISNNNNSTESNSSLLSLHRELERELRGLMSDSPSYVSQLLQSSNPVFKKLPIDYRSGSASTDKSDSLSESIPHSVSSGGSSGGSSRKAGDWRVRMDTNVEGDEQEEQEEDEGSCGDKLTYSRDSSLDRTHSKHNGLSPSTSQESLYKQ